MHAIVSPHDAPPILSCPVLSEPGAHAKDELAMMMTMLMGFHSSISMLEMLCYVLGVELYAKLRHATPRHATGERAGPSDPFVCYRLASQQRNQIKRNHWSFCVCAGTCRHLAIFA